MRPLTERAGPERRTLEFKGSLSSPDPSRVPTGRGGRSQGIKPPVPGLGHWATPAPTPGPLPAGCFLQGSPARQAHPGLGHTLVAQMGQGRGGPRPVPPASGVDVGCPAASLPAWGHEEGGLTSPQPPASSLPLTQAPAPRGRPSNLPQGTSCPHPIPQPQKPQRFGARHVSWPVL